MMDKVQCGYHKIAYSRWRKRCFCLNQRFSKHFICTVEVDREESNIIVINFGVSGVSNLSNLSKLQKRVKISRHFYVGDIVLLKTGLRTRNHWLMCKVTGTNSDDKVVVPSVRLLLGNSRNKDDNCILERVITKVALWLDVEDVDFPTKITLTYRQNAEFVVGSQL